MTERKYRKDDFMLPNGSFDIAKLQAAMDAENPSPEALRAAADEYARKHGKSLEDLLIEFIRSGDQGEADTCEAMEMLGTWPRSKFSNAKQ